MSTEKPTPAPIGAEELDEFKDSVSAGFAFTGDILERVIARIENDAKTIESLAGTGFASGCADGHAPIRHTGEKCPLCDALAGYADAVEDIKSWSAYANEYFQKKHDLAGTLAKHHAALSRPSSDPGAGEVGK